ncbi:MAG: hypothetical protein FWE85_00385 [Clostridiales bacterium]|nr:hypothetical protein [Clostridiales bacterium]
MMTIGTVTWVSLAIGLVFGFLAQRSRMCFIGGWRDFFLIRDTYLLKGFIAFFVAAAIFFAGFYFANYRVAMSNYPWISRDRPDVALMDLIDMGTWDNPFIPEQYREWGMCENMGPQIILKPGEDLLIRGITVFGYTIPYEWVLFLGATLFLGLFSTLANGCPIRQHTMAASGNASAMLYLIGFYLAIMLYDKWVAPFLNDLTNVFHVVGI